MARSKTKKRARKRGGPYVAAAVFCDNIVEGSDRALSAIRIIDQVTLTVPANAPADVPSEKKPLPYSAWVLMSFKTGDAKGNHRVQLVGHSPSGKHQVILDKHVLFSSEQHGGANLRTNVTLVVSKGGLFWLDVVLDGRVVTRMPLQISVARSEMPAIPPTGDLKKGKR
ncbi:MAG: hypothetical protein L0312_17930 [Acidobacteria bacterium]|nr:hypothetical protein [Acidobacteriota bacterium]